MLAGHSPVIELVVPAGTPNTYLPSQAPQPWWKSELGRPTTSSRRRQTSARDDAESWHCRPAVRYNAPERVAALWLAPIFFAGQRWLVAL